MDERKDQTFEHNFKRRHNQSDEIEKRQRLPACALVFHYETCYHDHYDFDQKNWRFFRVYLTQVRQHLTIEFLY